jgi:hypothetical protein
VIFLPEYFNDDKYEKIISFICYYRKIDKKQLMSVLKDKELKCLLFLLLKRFRCADTKRLSEDFSIKTKKSINYNLRKAEEKFFINKEFRERYFEVEELIEKIF